MAATISSRDDDLVGRPLAAASSGMNSMNRTLTPRSRPNVAKSTISSSLTPRMSTTLTLTGVKSGVEGGVDAVEHLVEAVAPGELDEPVAAAASRARC